MSRAVFLHFSFLCYLHHLGAQRQPSLSCTLWRWAPQVKVTIRKEK